MLILGGIICFVSFFISIQELGVVKINKNYKLAKMILVGSIVIIGSYYFPDLSTLIMLGSILVLLLVEKNSVLNTLISIIIITFITIILDISISTIVIKVMEFLYIDTMYNPIARLLIEFSLLLLTVLIAKRINIILLRLKKSGYGVTNILKNKILLIISCLSIIVILITNIFVLKDSQINYNFYALILTFAISYLFIGVIIVFGIYYNVKREVESKSREKELKTLIEYNENLESLYKDMRKFRHDYVNILSSMAGYIEEDDMAGLNEYFNTKIIPLGTDMNEKNLKIGLLHNIKIKEIKGVVITKMLQAQELGVEITIDIAEAIEKVNLDVIDLSRCIGILIDNALEAAVLCENGDLEIGFVKRSNSIMIIIVNSILEGAAPIHKIFEKGFSTKGENRGIGLSNLREILSKYPKASLDTVIEEGKFSQILEIY